MVVWEGEDEDRRNHHCKSCDIPTHPSHFSHCLTTRPHMQGFDEFMNLVMDNAEEVFVKNEVSRRPVGACH